MIGVLVAWRPEESAPSRDCGAGGEVRDELVGGEGAGGGTSRRLAGDLEALFALLLVLGAVGNW